MALYCTQEKHYHFNLQKQKKNSRYIYSNCSPTSEVHSALTSLFPAHLYSDCSISLELLSVFLSDSLRCPIIISCSLFFLSPPSPHFPAITSFVASASHQNNCDNSLLDDTATLRKRHYFRFKKFPLTNYWNLLSANFFYRFLMVSSARYAFCISTPKCILLGGISPKTPDIYIGASLFGAPFEKVRNFLTHLFGKVLHFLTHI